MKNIKKISLSNNDDIYKVIISNLKRIKGRIDFELSSDEEIDAVIRDVDKMILLVNSNKDILLNFIEKEEENNIDWLFKPDLEEEKLKKEAHDFVVKNKSEKNMGDICDFIEAAGVKNGRINSKALATISYMSKGNKFDEWKTFFMSLPFLKEKSEPPSSLQNFKDKLDGSHYGMEDVKRTLIEEAAFNMNGKHTNHVICLNGPPGVGKTSIAKAFAKAMGREFFVISLGGVCDVSDISGFQSTWNGATPGRIMKTMMMCKTANPIILLDEIDKTGRTSYGSVSSALLDVLDPKQRETYTDRYFGFPYDLSDVTFIATSNYIDQIPYELRDRMRVIDIPAYSSREKFLIAQDYILPELSEKSGISIKDIGMTDGLIREIIRDYTFEAGCRSLEKKLDSIVRHAVVQVALNEKTDVTSQSMRRIIGSPIPRPNITSHIGRINGLSVSAMGGAVMTIEAAIRRDSFKDENMNFVNDEQKTGNMRQVMLESISVAKTALISNMSELGMNDERRIMNAHVHAASAATPKDGPSAGLAISLAIMSAVTKQLPKEGVAMTGEISLSGDVLPIGGVRDKMFGAIKAGMNTMIIPQDNLDEAMKVDEKDREGLVIIPVSHLMDAVKVMFRSPAPINDEAEHDSGNEATI